MTRIKSKRRYKFLRSNKKSKRNTKKLRGGKIGQLPSRQKPIPLPNVPSLAPPVIKHKFTRKQKGGFRADEVDILEDRDDDWIITKQ